MGIQIKYLQRHLMINLQHFQITEQGMSRFGRCRARPDGTRTPRPRQSLGWIFLMEVAVQMLSGTIEFGTCSWIWTQELVLLLLCTIPSCVLHWMTFIKAREVNKKINFLIDFILRVNCKKLYRHTQSQTR